MVPGKTRAIGKSVTPQKNETILLPYVALTLQAAASALHESASVHNAAGAHAADEFSFYVMEKRGAQSVNTRGTVLTPPPSTYPTPVLSI